MQSVNLIKTVHCLVGIKENTKEDTFMQQYRGKDK